MFQFEILRTPCVLVWNFTDTCVLVWNFTDTLCFSLKSFPFYLRECVHACVRVRACVHCVFRMTLWPVHRGEIKYCLFWKSGFCFILPNRSGVQHRIAAEVRRCANIILRKTKCPTKQIRHLNTFHFPRPLCMCEYERHRVICDIWGFYRGVPKDFSVLRCQAVSIDT